MAEMDEPSMAKRCHRQLFVLLAVIGINTNSERKHDWMRLLYLFVLLLLSVWLTGCQLYPMLSNEFAKDNTWYISATDQYSVMAVVYVAAVKNKCIGPLIDDLLSAYRRTADCVDRRLKRLLALFSLVLAVYAMDMVGSTFAAAFNTPNTQHLQLIYFGIQSKRTIQIINLITVATAKYFVLILYISGCFNVILCFLIKECFKGLNVKFKVDRDFWYYLAEHRKISNLVNRYNSIFHPFILISISTLMLQLVTLTEDVTKYINATETSLCIRACVYVIYLVEMTFNFIIFIYFGHQIRCEAQNGMDILLDNSISTQTSTDQPHDQRLQQLTTVFTARLMTSPVAITASGLFDIDYNLITVVVSIGMAYITLMSTFKSNNSSAKVTSPIDCSLCPVINDSSVSPFD